MSKSKKSAYNGGAPVRSVNRSCTDILCLLLFVVFIGGWIAVGVIGIISGKRQIEMEIRETGK